MGNTRRVPYRLPEVLFAEEVFIVEGEKDADVLDKAQRVATCNPGARGSGSQNMRNTFAESGSSSSPTEMNPAESMAKTQFGRSLASPRRSWSSMLA
jgi:hypothetical protein